MAVRTDRQTLAGGSQGITAEQKPSAATPREGLPEIEYPSPFFVRNTFIDTVTDLSHLDSFYEERTIRSTPAVVMEMDPNLAVRPKSPSTTASSRSTSVGSVCSRSGADNKSPTSSPGCGMQPAYVQRTRSGRVLEEFDYPTPVFFRHTFLHFGHPLSDEPGKARSCPVSGVEMSESSDEDDEPPFLSIFGAASSKKKTSEKLPVDPEPTVQGNDDDDDEDEPPFLSIFGAATSKRETSGDGASPVGEAAHQRDRLPQPCPPTPVIPSRAPQLSPAAPKLPAAMLGCIVGQQLSAHTSPLSNAPTPTPPLKSPDVAARLPQRSPAALVLPLAPRVCTAGQLSSTHGSPSSSSHAPTPVLKSPEVAARLPSPKGLAPRTAKHLRLAEVLGGEPMSPLLPPERRTDSLPTASALAASMGSIAHDLGICKPCAHAHKPHGCRNGDRCTFCHICPAGELKRKQRAKRAAYRAHRAQ